MAEEETARTNSDYSSEFSEYDVYSDDDMHVDRYHNMSSHRCDLDYIGPKPPKIKHKPRTTELDESEFKFLTSQAAGILKHKKALRPSNVTSLIAQRQAGLRSAEGFNGCNRSRISNKYLPTEMETLDRYEGKAYCGIFSKDGKYFISAAQDHAIRLYNTENGVYDHFKTISGRDVEWSILDVAVSPNNQEFVYSSWSPSLHICPINGDPEKHETLALVKGTRKFCVFSVAFSSDGNEVLCGANDGYMYIYDRRKNRRTLKIPAHEFDVNTVTFADDSSNLICTGGDDGLIKVWDRRMLGPNESRYDSVEMSYYEAVKKPPPVGILAGHRDGITHVETRGDGRHLISNSKDQTIKLWDLRSFSTREAMGNTLGSVKSQRWDYRWQGVPQKMSTQTDRLAGDTSLMTYRGHGIIRTLIRCRFSPAELTGQRYIYTGCGYGRVLIYDALTGRVKKLLTGHTNCVRDVSWHPHTNEIISSSWDGSLGRWYYNRINQEI